MGTKGSACAKPAPKQPGGMNWSFFFVAFVHSLHPVGVCWFGTNWFWTPLGVLIKPIQAFQVCAGLFFVTCPYWNSCVFCRMECTPCAQLSGQNIKNDADVNDVPQPCNLCKFTVHMLFPVLSINILPSCSPFQLLYLISSCCQISVILYSKLTMQ